MPFDHATSILTHSPALAFLQTGGKSLALAADSYGWEGRAEWKQAHPEKAAPLFLTQLALGDESAAHAAMIQHIGVGGKVFADMIAQMGRNP